MTTADSAGLATLIGDLVTANHILATQGVVDGYGHVSARHPQREDCYLMSRSMPPAQVSAADILELTLDGETVASGSHRLFLERFIHSEVYRVRPDVMAVVHSHSHSAIALGVTDAGPLRALFHMAAFLGTSTPVFEIRDVRGDGSDMLVRDAELGRAMAAKLGAGPVILMRGHGSTVVGGSLRETVVRAVYAEINARLQCAAMQLGNVKYLSAAETAAAAATNASHLDRPWDLWKEQARERLGR